MDVRVFVSSTSEDLKHKKDKTKDCRYCAEQAILSAGAEPVMSERWVITRGEAFTRCRQMLIESTHYIGIISFRRGFQPPGAEKSITQAEYEWALDYQKPQAVLVPAPGSLFAAKLEERAKNQSAAERAAQDAFLKTIWEDGTFTPFENTIDLTLKVNKHVYVWKAGGIVPLAGRRVASGRNTNEEIKVGRRRQMGQFVGALDFLESAGIPRVAAFVVHGPEGFGHEELLQRMRHQLRSDADNEPIYRFADVEPDWGKLDLGRLLKALGLGDTHAALTQKLGQALPHTDVILDIGNVQRFDGSVPGFVKNFWAPVANSLRARLPNRLIAFLRVEHPTPRGWDAQLQNSLPRGVYDVSRPFKLHELTAFDEEELKGWLEGRVSKEKLGTWTKTLMRETGGNPRSVYNKLQQLRGTAAP